MCIQRVFFEKLDGRSTLRWPRSRVAILLTRSMAADHTQSAMTRGTGAGRATTKQRLIPSEPSPRVIFLGSDPGFAEPDVSLLSLHPRLLRVVASCLPRQQQLQHRVSQDDSRRIVIVWPPDCCAGHRDLLGNWGGPGELGIRPRRVRRPTGIVPSRERAVCSTLSVYVSNTYRGDGAADSPGWIPHFQRTSGSILRSPILIPTYTRSHPQG